MAENETANMSENLEASASANNPVVTTASVAPKRINGYSRYSNPVKQITLGEYFHECCKMLDVLLNDCAPSAGHPAKIDRSLRFAISDLESFADQVFDDGALVTVDIQVRLF